MIEYIVHFMYQFEGQGEAFTASVASAALNIDEAVRHSKLVMEQQNPGRTIVYHQIYFEEGSWDKRAPMQRYYDKAVI